jgi:hypothetical protein
MTNPLASQQPAPTELELVANMLEEIWGLPESAGYVRAAEARIARLEAALTECAEVIFGNVIADKRTADAYNNANRLLATPLGTPGSTNDGS